MVDAGGDVCSMVRKNKQKLIETCYNTIAQADAAKRIRNFKVYKKGWGSIMHASGELQKIEPCLQAGGWSKEAFTRGSKSKSTKFIDSVATHIGMIFFGHIGGCCT